MRQLPQTKTCIATATCAIQIHVFHKHFVGFARVKLGLKFRRGAVLENQGFQRFVIVHYIPSGHIVICACCDVAGGRVCTRAVIIGKHRVVGIKEVLTIIANSRFTFFQQAPHQFIGQSCCTFTHRLHHRAIHTHLVIFNIGTLHAHGGFKLFIVQTHRLFRHFANLALSYPFTHFREFTQPCVSIGGGGAGNGHRNRAVRRLRGG